MKLFQNLLVLSALILTGFGCAPYHGVVWQDYKPEVMDQALKMQKPIVMNFYAAWCGPCHMMKEKTFTNPQVIAALEPFTRIKVDMSFIHSKKIIQLADRYEVQSFPTVIFFNSQGTEVIRMNGYASSEDILNLLSEYKNRLS